MPQPHFPPSLQCPVVAFQWPIQQEVQRRKKSFHVIHSVQPPKAQAWREKGEVAQEIFLNG